MYGLDNPKQINQQQLINGINHYADKGMTPFSTTAVTKFATKVGVKTLGYERFELSGYVGNGKRTFFMVVKQFSGLFNIEYEEDVNRRREAEGLRDDFKALSDTYDRMNNIVRKKGDYYYFAYRPEDKRASFKPVIVGFRGGEYVIVDKAEIEPWLPKRKEPTSGRQELSVENQVQARKIAVPSIMAITIDKNDYIVESTDEARKAAFDLAIGNV